MSEIEFFELCYLEEIDSLFKEFQEITKFYNLNLFHTMNKDNSSELFNFIFESINFQDLEIPETDILSDQEIEYS
jgi:Na+-transporting NADH:ubiquinone oxidoreductase subunit NqrF